MQAKALMDNFHWLGGDMQTHPMEDYEELDRQGNLVKRPIGDALTITKRPEAPVQVFLGAHMDTVYGVDHPFQKPRFVSETIMNGPGVADLKGGIVVMLKALEALEKYEGAERVGWRVVFNPDEENRLQII
jgi:glutamate carboxypeptidase